MLVLVSVLASIFVLLEYICSLALVLVFLLLFGSLKSLETGLGTRNGFFTKLIKLVKI